MHLVPRVCSAPPRVDQPRRCRWLPPKFRLRGSAGLHFPSYLNMSFSLESFIHWIVLARKVQSGPWEFSIMKCLAVLLAWTESLEFLNRWPSENMMLELVFGRTDFSRIFYFFEPPEFFADFVSGFFSSFLILSPDFFSSFLWEKVPRKSFQENPRQYPPKFIQKKSPTHFCRGAGPNDGFKEASRLSAIFGVTPISAQRNAGFKQSWVLLFCLCWTARAERFFMEAGLEQGEPWKVPCGTFLGSKWGVSRKVRCSCVATPANWQRGQKRVKKATEK